MAAAAAALSLSRPPDPPHRHLLRLRANPFAPATPPGLRTHLSAFPNLATRSLVKPSFSPYPTPSSAADSSSPFVDDSFRPSKFLTNEEFDKLKFLEGYSYSQELPSGRLTVRVMRADEMDDTVKLLAESFADSMLLPPGYVPVLRFLVKQYLIERRSVLPYAVTLIGYYRRRAEDSEVDDDDEEEEELAGTVEVCFEKRGANASPPTPTPPKNAPYICNMTVKEHLRRRGIGWHLLKASEELISEMSSEREVYLHCRMIDLGPFNMYMKAGYRVVKTDGFLVLLMFQRRKHLMAKELPVITESSSEFDSSGSDEERAPDEERAHDPNQ